ncbi:MAG: hypothetical protein J1E57_06600 [Prevotella sp.]|nr:hypothetical protein [Prevotella sp.]
MQFALFIIVIVGIAFGIQWYCFEKINNQKLKDVIEEMEIPPIILSEGNDFLKIKTGSVLKYSHSIHESVGYSYNVEYDNTAFEMDYSVKYGNPSAVEAGMCGGDAAVKTCTFKTLKRGTYTIRIIHEFRSNIEGILNYKISVK